MDAIIKRYNNLMESIGKEYCCIDSDNNTKWNLRDMVSEVQYWLDFWQCDDSIYREEAMDTFNPDHKEIYNQYRNDLARMKRFIARYESEALKLVCTEGHCSMYD